MKKIRILSLMLVVILLFAACQAKPTVETPSEGAISSESPGDISAAPENEKLVFAYLCTKAQADYWTIVINGVKDQAEKLGVEIVVYDAERDANKQLAQGEDALTLDIDGMILSPVDTVGDTIIDKCDNLGIPVVICDNGSENTKYIQQIVSDSYQLGIDVADFLYEKLGDELRVACYDIANEQAVMKNRQRGFTDRMEELGVEIVAKPVAQARDASMTAMENTLQAVPDINAVWALNDENAQGAVSAVLARGMSFDDIMIIGVDANPDACESIARGEQYLSIAQEPYKFGAQSVQTLVDFLNGKDVIKNITPPFIWVTKENVEEFMSGSLSEWPTDF